MFHRFLTLHTDEILRRCRKRMLERMVLRPTEEELAKGLPLFLGQLIESLRRYNGSMPQGPLEIGRDAARFGRDLSRLGFTVTQLVHGYGAVSEAATALAHELGFEIGPEEHEVLNSALDMAVAEAVDGYEQEHDSRTSRETSEHPGVCAHELRSALAAASVSFRTLKRTQAGCNGRVGDRLEQSLTRMRRLIDRALAEARLQAGTAPLLQEVPLVELLDQVVATAQLGAESRRLTLSARIDSDLNLRGDRQLILSALANLIDDAVASTKSGGHVQMRGYSRGEMVVIEIEDECGDLPRGNAGSVAPATPHTRPDRPGLAVARKAVSLHGGTVLVRNTPGDGCVVVVEIPAATSEAQPDAFAPAH